MPCEIRYGIRPLVVGNNKMGYLIASETIALGTYNYIRDIKPGEIIEINANKLNTVYQYPNTIPNFCSLEYIYFMNYKSKIQNKEIGQVRYELGKALGQLEIIYNKTNCIVVPVPNSSIPNGKGFADGAGLEYAEYITRNPKILRTFILPTQQDRQVACELKFGFLDKEIKQKIIYLVDDSIVRGTTMKILISKLRMVGASAVHVRIISPPVISPCYFGIDMSTHKELLAYGQDIANINKLLGSDSVKYLDINKLKEILKEPVCTSCFTGQYDAKLLDW